MTIIIKGYQLFISIVLFGKLSILKISQAEWSGKGLKLEFA